MNTYTTLRNAAEYINEHGWAQATFEDDDGSVCLHGAIHSCTPQHGDAAIVAGVLCAFRLDYAWNDHPSREERDVLLALNSATITDGHLAYAYGPQWQEIVSLLRRAATLTETDARKIEESRANLTHAGSHTKPLSLAYSDALRLYRQCGDDGTYRFVSDIMTAAYNGLNLSKLPSVAGQATRCCLAALAARHLIGHRLFTQTDYNFLTIPIRVVLGPIHPDDKDQP